MYDLNQPSDVIEQMRDGDMSDDEIVKVCARTIAQVSETYNLHEIVNYPSRKNTVKAEIVAHRTIVIRSDKGTDTTHNYVLRLKNDFGTIVGEAAQATLDRYNKAVA